MIEDVVVKLKKIEDQLAAYDSSIGFAIPDRSDSPLDDYLSLTSAELGRKSAVELAAIGVDIAAYLVFFQKEFNKHRARAFWSEAELNLILGPEMMKVQGYSSYQERRATAIACSEYCQKVEELRIRSQTMIFHLEGLAERLEKFAKSIDGYRYSAFSKSNYTNKIGKDEE